MSDDLISAEQAQALLDPIEVDRLAVTSRVMGTVCDAKGWQTSTARHHRKVADTLEAQAAEIARLRDALIEARHHVYQASIDRAQPTEASEALTLIDAALTAHKEGKE